MESNGKLATQLALAYAVMKHIDLSQEIASNPERLHDGITELKSIISNGKGRSSELAFAFRRTLIDIERENELQPIARLDFKPELSRVSYSGSGAQVAPVVDAAVPTDDKFRLYPGQAVKLQLALAYAKSHREDLADFAKTLEHPVLADFAQNAEKRDIAIDAAMIRLEKRNALPALTLGGAYHDYTFVLVDKETKNRAATTVTAYSRDEALALGKTEVNEVAQTQWTPDSMAKTSIRALLARPDFEATLARIDEHGALAGAEAGMKRVKDAGFTPYCLAQVPLNAERLVFDKQHAAKASQLTIEEDISYVRNTKSGRYVWALKTGSNSRQLFSKIELHLLSKASFAAMALDARYSNGRSINERIDVAIAGYQDSRDYFKELTAHYKNKVSISPSGEINPDLQRKSAMEALESATQELDDIAAARKKGNVFSRIFSGKSGGR